MSRIEFEIPALNKTVGFSVPSFKNSDLDKTQKLLKFVDYLKTSIYLILIAILPISFLFNGNEGLVVGDRFVSYENSVFVAAISFGIVILGLTLVEVSLAGTKRLSDSAGLLVVLVFSLLVTTAAVLVPNQVTENTFGSIQSASAAAFKSLSGLAVITYLFYFYITSSLVKTEKLKNYFRKVLFFSLTFVFLFRLIPVDTVEYFLIGILPTLYFLNKLKNAAINSSKKSNLKLFTYVAINGILLWNLSLSLTKQTARSIVQVLVSILITLIIFLIYTLIVKKGLLTNQFNVLSESFKAKKRSFKVILNAFLNLEFMPIVSVLLLILGIKLVYSLDLSTLFNLGLNSTENAFGIINNSTRSLFVGSGSSVTNFQSTFFYSIIVSHGILGVIAYLMVWLFAGFAALKNSALESKSNAFEKVVNSYLIFVPVLSFFTYPGFIALLLWWIFLALTLTQKSKDLSTKDFYTINDVKLLKLKLNLSKSKKLRLFFSLIGVVIAGGILYIFNSNIGTVL